MNLFVYLYRLNSLSIMQHVKEKNYMNEKEVLVTVNQPIIIIFKLHNNRL